MSKDPNSSYYDQGGIEVLDIIKAKLTAEQYEGYLLGNSIKYSLRLNWKGNKARDAEKAAIYSKWFNDAIKELTDVPMSERRVGTSHGSAWLFGFQVGLHAQGSRHLGHHCRSRLSDRQFWRFTFA